MTTEIRYGAAADEAKILAELEDALSKMLFKRFPGAIRCHGLDELMAEARLGALEAIRAGDEQGTIKKFAVAQARYHVRNWLSRNRSTVGVRLPSGRTPDAFARAPVRIGREGAEPGEAWFEPSAMEVQSADVVEKLVMRGVVDVLLQRLPPRERAALTVKFHGEALGVTARILADALGVNERTVERLKVRALTRLQRSATRGLRGRVPKGKRRAAKAAPAPVEPGTVEVARDTRRRAKQPIGAIVVRLHGNGSGSGRALQHRWIKISDRGPSKDRWVRYAKWLWEKTHGPVPAGKRVCHLNGDTMDDRLENLAALAPGEDIGLWHIQNPGLSRRNYATLKTGSARSNRERSKIAHAFGELCSDRWYLVDEERGIIVAVPHRERWLAYKAAGVPVAPRLNGMGYEAAAIGWPPLCDFAATILAALCDHDDWVRTSALRETLREARRRRGLSTDFKPLSIWQFMTMLRRAGLVESRRGGAGRSGESAHRATESARATRRPPCRWLAVLGKNLRDERHRSFKRVFDFSDGDRVPA